MTFYAFGLNHDVARIETTEAFRLNAEAQKELYETLELGEGVEILFLSTCNRNEVYLYGREEDVASVQDVLSRQAGQSWPSDQAFCYENEEAVRHVLQVTSGLRSMVLGDDQIFAQVKGAYQRAVDHGGIQSVMHRLMHAAFHAAKEVASETDLSMGSSSVSTAAVAMARNFFATESDDCDFQKVDVLLVGAGQMGELAVKALREEGVEDIQVTNRSLEPAQSVADQYGGEVVSWTARHRAVETADVIIVATGASESVLTASDVQTGRSGVESDHLFVDISMPRTVDPRIDEIEGCTVYDLDDLKTWTERVEANRESEIPHARAICEKQLDEFVTWVFHQEAMAPAIQAIRDTFDSIRAREVERHAHRTDMERDEVHRLTKSIMQKLLAVPIVKLKNVDPDSIDFVQGIRLLQALFSRPSCEDESARSLDERPESHVPSLSDLPVQAASVSPESESQGAGELIRRALRVSRDDVS